VPVADSEAMAEAMIRLLSNTAHARELGLRGRALADELFDVSKCIERTQSFYQRVFASHPHSEEPVLKV
jgi:glycosyltransferase involved in cell wall biosynthesis